MTVETGPQEAPGTRKVKGSDLFECVFALDERTLAEALEAPDKWLQLGMVERTFTVDQAQQLAAAMPLDGYRGRRRNTHLRNRAGVIVGLAMHCPRLKERRDELVAELPDHQQEEVDRGLAAAEQLDLRELREPGYANDIYAPVTLFDTFYPGNSRVVELARVAEGKTLTLAQIRELLTIFHAGRLNPLEHLVFYWDGQGDADLLLDLMFFMDHDEVRALMANPPTEEQRATLRGAFGERVRQMLNEVTGVKAKTLEKHFSSERLSSIQIRFLLTLIDYSYHRDDALDVLLPLWDLTGDPRDISTCFSPRANGELSRAQVEERLAELTAQAGISDGPGPCTAAPSPSRPS